MKKYYPDKPVNIHIQLSINTQQKNNWVIATKKGKGKLPLFCGNRERVIPIYAVYCAPRFHNFLSIHLLSDLLSYPNPKYLTSICQQLFLPSPGDYIYYKPHRAFSTYLAYSGRISIISESVAPIKTLIHERFHHPHSMDHKPHLHISPYTLVANIPTSQTDTLLDFLLCVKQSKFGSIFGPILPDPSSNYMSLCSLIPD